MRQPPHHRALRYSLGAAALTGAVVGGDVALQAWRRASFPHAHWLVVVNYLMIAAVACVVVAAGYLSARGIGRVWPGLWAAALVVLPTALAVAFFSNLGKFLQPRANIGTLAFAVALLAVAASLAGAAVAVPGAFIGRASYRREHAAEWAAQVAARRQAREEAAARARRRRLSAKEWGAVWAFLLAILALATLPVLAAEFAYSRLSLWEGLALAVGALLASVGLLSLAAGRMGWVAFVVDWLMAALLVLGLILGVGEVTGYEIYFLTGAGMLAFMWLAGDHYLSQGSAREPDGPERQPVFFRHDSQPIDLYPNRLTLARHAAFAGGVVVVASLGAYLVRGWGPTPVFLLGAFAAMGLIGFIPDVARLLARWPSLTITSDGLIDRGSALLLGFGPIPWHEIEGVGVGIYSELAIYPVSFNRLLERQPLLKRPLLRLASALRGGSIAVPSLVLPERPSVVAQRIRDYVQSHAPADYWKDDDDIADGEELAESGRDDQDTAAGLP